MKFTLVTVMALAASVIAAPVIEVRGSARLPNAAGSDGPIGQMGPTAQKHRRVQAADVIQIRPSVLSSPLLRSTGARPAGFHRLGPGWLRVRDAQPVQFRGRVTPADFTCHNRFGGRGWKREAEAEAAPQETATVRAGYGFGGRGWKREAEAEAQEPSTTASVRAGYGSVHLHRSQLIPASRYSHCFPE